MSSCRRQRSRWRKPTDECSALSPSIPAPSTSIRRSEEHTSELQSHRDLHSFPTRRSSDLLIDELVPATTITVAEADGRMLGFVTVDPRTFDIDQTVVAPEAWGLGVAAALIAEAKRISPA